MPSQTQTRTIVIKVDSQGAAGIKDLADKLGGINKNTKDLAKGFGTLGAATTAFLGGLSVRELAGFSDEIQQLNNRLLSMTGNQSEATKTLSALVNVARETNQSLAGISEGYFRMSLALKDAGVSQATLIDLTKTVSNTFRLSGASTQEAANATIQLGQAFSLGVLRGQDLRSVMSQNVTLTRLLRKEFGNNLLKDAEKGLITVPKLMEILYKNMKQVNEQAKVMSATFEQTTTKGLDAFKLKVYELSSALDLPAKFAKGMDYLIQNMGAVITVGAILSTATFPALISSVYALAVSLGVLNPAVLILVGGLAAVTAAFGESWDISDLIVQMQVGFSKIVALLESFKAGIYDSLAALTFLSKATTDNFKKMANAARQASKDADIHAQALWLERDAMKALAKQQQETGNASKRWADDIKRVKDAFQPELDPQKMLAALNAEYRSGAIDVAEYNQRILQFDLDKANYKFKEGKINLDQLNEAIRKVELAKLNRAFRDGAIDTDSFNRSIKKLELQKMNEDLAHGKISIADFNSKLASVSESFSISGAFRTGLQDYLTAIGTTTQQVAGVIKGAFSNLEDEMLAFIKNGEFNFAKFTQTILDDLTRIILRATIIQPLAQGLLNYASTPSASTGGGYGSAGGGGGGATYAAKGAYFDNGLAKFAKGGVVSTPTAFGYGNGKAGVMGEAGPEAILPLQRSGGVLGVAASVNPVTINIINQNGSDVQQTEKTGPNGEKQIEILIAAKVRDGISNGKFDKVMKSSYGINRKGS